MRYSATDPLLHKRAYLGSIWLSTAILALVLIFSAISFAGCSSETDSSASPNAERKSTESPPAGETSRTDTSDSREQVTALFGTTDNEAVGTGRDESILRETAHLDQNRARSGFAPDATLTLHEVEGSIASARINDSLHADLATIFPYGDWSCEVDGKTRCNLTEQSTGRYQGSLRYTCDLYDEMEKGPRGGDCGHPESFGSALKGVQDLPHVSIPFQVEVQTLSGEMRIKPLSRLSKPNQYVKSYLRHHQVSTSDWRVVRLREI